MSVADPSSMDGEEVLRRGFRGSLALGLRQVAVQLLNVAAAVVLARILSPAEFGVYGITVFLMHFLVAFGDAGLAASLVREADVPEERDYRAVFTAQQLIVAAVVVVGWVIGPPLAAAVDSGSDLAPLVPGLLAALALTSLQSVPAARLERAMAFDKLAAVEVAQAIAFQAVAVGLALAGCGTVAMAGALVARSATGAVAVQVVAPWRPAWVWEPERVRWRLRFGLPFQCSAVLNLVRDALTPVFIGATAGAFAVGQVFFAQMLASYPLIVLWMLQRVLLPAFARLQEDADGLRRTFRISVFALAAVAIPIQTLVFAMQEPLTRLVFGAQWNEALPIYSLHWFGVLLEPQLIAAMALLNALGRSARTFRFLAVLTLGSWMVGVPSLLVFGPIGFGVASVTMLLVKYRLVAEVDTIVGESSMSTVASVWLAAVVAAAAGFVAQRMIAIDSLASLSVCFAACTSIYVVVLAASDRRRAFAAWQWVAAEMRGVVGWDREGTP